MTQATGKYIIIAGLIIVVAGIIIYFFHEHFRWFGNLPGDVKLKSDRVKFYFPIVTMIIVSIVLTIVINLLRKFL
jgi:H+/Cl- antiporter ClcA